MWIARDIDNHLHLFLLKPIRNIDHWISTANDIDYLLAFKFISRDKMGTWAKRTYFKSSK